MLRISHNLPAVELSISSLPARLRTALTRTLNRTIVSTQQFMVGRMAGKTGIPALVVEGRLAVARATDAKPEAETAPSKKSQARLIPVLQLRARQIGMGPTVPGGVVFQFDGATRTLPNAFIATMRSGHKGVFSRTGRHRLPIIEEKGPSWRTLFELSETEGVVFAERELAVNAQIELQAVAASV